MSASKQMDATDKSKDSAPVGSPPVVVEEKAASRVVSEPLIVEDKPEVADGNDIVDVTYAGPYHLVDGKTGLEFNPGDTVRMKVSAILDLESRSGQDFTVRKVK